MDHVCPKKKKKINQRISEEVGRGLMSGRSHPIFLFLNENMRRHSRGLLVKCEKSEPPMGLKKRRSRDAELKKEVKAQMSR